MEMRVKLATRSSPGSRTIVFLLTVVVAVLTLGGVGRVSITAVILGAGRAGARRARATLAGLTLAAPQSVGSSDGS
jgi:hypothetical protein